MKAFLFISMTFLAFLAIAEEKNDPLFYCGFNSKEEITEKQGLFSEKASFTDGVDGKALDLKKGTICLFSTENCITGNDGTLTAWMLPHWDLRDIKSGMLQMFRIANEEQGKNAPHNYNYFCILGHSYGNVEKGIPYQLYCYINAESNQEAGLLVMPDASWQAETWQHVAVTWRINTGKKDGEFTVYVNGKQIGKVTDFRAEKLKLGKKLSIAPDGAIDELKIWNRILSEDEIKTEFSKYKSTNKE